MFSGFPETDALTVLFMSKPGCLVAVCIVMGDAGPQRQFRRGWHSLVSKGFPVQRLYSRPEVRRSVWFALLPLQVIDLCLGLLPSVAFAVLWVLRTALSTRFGGFKWSISN